MKAPKVLSVRVADAPRFGVVAYGVVQSRSRSNRINHTVVKQGRAFHCSCEDHIFRAIICDHIKAFKVKLAQRRAA